MLLGKQMGLSQALVGDLFLAGLIHDIGKIGVRDEVLWKAGEADRRRSTTRSSSTR